MVSSVLLIDDDPAFLALAARIVEELGVEVVTTAQDMTGAIAAANATRPEAAIVDVGLPEREGIDLAYELAALPWRPRVVLTSSDKDAAGAVAGHPRGTLPFVPKEELADGSLRRLLTMD